MKTWGWPNAICTLHMFNIGRCCERQRVTVEWRKSHAVHGGHARNNVGIYCRRLSQRRMRCYTRSHVFHTPILTFNIELMECLCPDKCKCMQSKLCSTTSRPWLGQIPSVTIQTHGASQKPRSVYGFIWSPSVVAAVVHWCFIRHFLSCAGISPS